MTKYMSDGKGSNKGLSFCLAKKTMPIMKVWEYKPAGGLSVERRKEPIILVSVLHYPA